MIHVCFFRLKLMYAGISVKILVAVITLIASLLLYGLYQGAGEASKLKIGVYFPGNGSLSKTISKSLEENEILLPITYGYEEGIRAVKESRVEAFFVFREDMKESIEKGDYEGLVEVYFLEENRMSYLLTDILGAELMGEIALVSALDYLEGALVASEKDLYKNESYMQGLYTKGLQYSGVETDNFFVRQTYINEKNITVDDVVLSNEILYKQIIYGVVYIFAAFFLMFLGVSIVSDRELGLGNRWYATGMSDIGVFIGEWLSIWIGGLPLILAMTGVQTLLDGHIFYYLAVNILFILAYSSFVLLMANAIDKVTVYVLTMTAVVLIGGIVSGSFFALDMEQSVVLFMTLLTPSYHLLTSLLNLETLDYRVPSRDYFMLMSGYTIGILILGYLLRKVRRLIIRGWSL